MIATHIHVGLSAVTEDILNLLHYLSLPLPLSLLLPVSLSLFLDSGLTLMVGWYLSIVVWRGTEGNAPTGVCEVGGEGEGEGGSDQTLP